MPHCHKQVLTSSFPFIQTSVKCSAQVSTPVQRCEWVEATWSLTQPVGGVSALLSSAGPQALPSLIHSNNEASGC